MVLFILIMLVAGQTLVLLKHIYQNKADYERREFLYRMRIYTPYFFIWIMMPLLIPIMGLSILVLLGSIYNTLMGLYILYKAMELSSVGKVEKSKKLAYKATALCGASIMLQIMYWLGKVSK